MHTPRDAVGTITATARHGQVRIEVSDDGPGVAADKLPHIFERFYRAGTGASRPGSGLGLAIVREVAAAHGGTSTAALASSRGLLITLTLPVGQGDGEGGEGDPEELKAKEDALVEAVWSVSVHEGGTE